MKRKAMQINATLEKDLISQKWNIQIANAAEENFKLNSVLFVLLTSHIVASYGSFVSYHSYGGPS